MLPTGFDSAQWDRLRLSFCPANTNPDARSVPSNRTNRFLTHCANPKKEIQRQQQSQIFVRYVSLAEVPSVGFHGSVTHRGTTKTSAKQPPSSKQQPTTSERTSGLFSDFFNPSPPSATGMFLFLFYLLVIDCLLGSIFCSPASAPGNVVLTSPSVAPSKRRAIRGKH